MVFWGVKGGHRRFLRRGHAWNIHPVCMLSPSENIQGVQEKHGREILVHLLWLAYLISQGATGLPGIPQRGQGIHPAGGASCQAMLNAPNKHVLSNKEGKYHRAAAGCASFYLLRNLQNLGVPFQSPANQRNN